MKILITGGAGYIGSHVVKALAETEHEIFIVDNLQKGHREAVAAGTFLPIDLGDSEALEQVFRENQFDGVIHLAADSLVGESMEDPAKYYANNLLNGYHLLEAMRKHQTQFIVFSSTAAVYGEPEVVPITEEAATCPTNVYGRTKLHFEEMLQDYGRAYGLRYISLRYFNAAGADPSGLIGEDHAPESHLIPIIFQRVLGQRDKLAIFGTDYDTPDGTCIRDYIHVNDLALAHILAVEALQQGHESSVYNLGNGQGYSVREVIDTVSRVVGQKIPVTEEPRREGDPAVLIASSQRIREELNWQPQFPKLETIIETAWRWHQNHPRGYAE